MVPADLPRYVFGTYLDGTDGLTQVCLRDLPIWYWLTYLYGSGGDEGMGGRDGRVLEVFRVELSTVLQVIFFCLKSITVSRIQILDPLALLLSRYASPRQGDLEQFAFPPG